MSEFKAGDPVRVTLYYRNGVPMCDDGKVIERDGGLFVDFDDYDRFDDSGVATSAYVPLANFIEVRLLPIGEPSEPVETLSEEVPASDETA
jgi:hypothetical protein